MTRCSVVFNTGTAYIPSIGVSQTGCNSCRAPQSWAMREEIAALTFSWTLSCSLAQGCTVRTAVGLEKLAGVLVGQPGVGSS
jgi:hypothetical protein